jgi:hypothetical protein
MLQFYPLLSAGGQGGQEAVRRRCERLRVSRRIRIRVRTWCDQFNGVPVPCWVRRGRRIRAGGYACGGVPRQPKKPQNANRKPFLLNRRGNHHGTCWGFPKSRHCLLPLAEYSRKVLPCLRNTSYERYETLTLFVHNRR